MGTYEETVWCGTTGRGSQLCIVKLELELIQTHMAQRPILRVEVFARCVARESKRKRGWLGWTSAMCRALASINMITS
jgi:hypothetical protein